MDDFAFHLKLVCKLPSTKQLFKLYLKNGKKQKILSTHSILTIFQSFKD